MLPDQSTLVQTLMGTGLTWFVTALGAFCCIFQAPLARTRFEYLLLDSSLGFAAGVMLAASFWSLLLPALESADLLLGWGNLAVVPVCFGIILGALFVGLADLVVPTGGGSGEKSNLAKHEKMHVNGIISSQSECSTIRLNNFSTSTVRRRRHDKDRHRSAEPVHLDVPNESPSKTVSMIINRRLWLLILAVTVHNIPEGLAVGIGFAGTANRSAVDFIKARNLAIGIALQNFPEGFAVSLPLMGAGFGFWKSFWYGQLSGLVEPLAGIFGCLAVQFSTCLQPYALGFAAGAMLFVVFDDIIPEAHQRGNGRLASCMTVLGFIVMMIMDVATSDD